VRLRTLFLGGLVWALGGCTMQEDTYSVRFSSAYCALYLQCAAEDGRDEEVCPYESPSEEFSDCNYRSDRAANCIRQLEVAQCLDGQPDIPLVCEGVYVCDDSDRP